jgi:hypothetical protein
MLLWQFFHDFEVNIVADPAHLSQLDLMVLNN